MVPNSITSNTISNVILNDWKNTFARKYYKYFGVNLQPKIYQHSPKLGAQIFLKVRKFFSSVERRFKFLLGESDFNTVNIVAQRNCRDWWHKNFIDTSAIFQYTEENQCNCFPQFKACKSLKNSKCQKLTTHQQNKWITSEHQVQTKAWYRYEIQQSLFRIHVVNTHLMSKCEESKAIFFVIEN